MDMVWKGAVAAGAALLATQPASAQEFPQQPVTIVVPAAAGGPSDTVARLVAEAMSRDLGQQVLIENMGGAGGSLGAGRVAEAEPDGYTLLLYHVAVATWGALYPDLTFKPAEAFAPVGLVTDVPMTLVARKDMAAADVGGLLTWLKGEGAGATFGTAGTGSAADLCGRLLMQSAGIELTVVPYKGTGPAMTDLMGGQIDLMCDQTTNTVNQIKAQEIKAYAVTTPAPIPVLPDLPPLAASGVAEFDVTAWHGLWAPAGTPDAVVAKLSAALQKALTDPTVIERFAALGTVPVAGDLASPPALEARLTSEIARWDPLLRATANQ